MGLLLPFVVVLGACGHSTVSGIPLRTPSGFRVQPEIADPGCNGGHGIQFSSGLGDSIVASSLMPDSTTLIALTSIYPAKRFAVLDSITPSCTRSPGFGTNGVSRIGLPRQLRASAAHRQPLLGSGFWIETIVPRDDGGAIMTGTLGGQWLVVELTASGVVDRHFGRGGWALLPFRGDVTAVMQEPSGRIVVAGDNGGGGCCTLTWAAALTATGRLDRRFGVRGREELPTGGDSGVELLAREPNGSILVKIGYGNMGCWGVGLAMLTPGGRPVPGFAERLNRFWGKLDFGAFTGDVYVDGAGFTLVGTGERPCAEALKRSPPSLDGVVAHFRSDGRLVGEPGRFTSRAFEYQVLTDRAGALVVTSPYASLAKLTLTVRRPDGSVDTGVATGGRAEVRESWRGRGPGVETVVLVGPASDGTVVVLAWNSGAVLQLIRLRT